MFIFLLCALNPEIISAALIVCLICSSVAFYFYNFTRWLNLAAINLHTGLKLKW